MEIVVTNERTSKRGFDCSTRIIHKLKELFGQTKTTKQEETDKHQSRKVDHFANRSICFCGIPCVEIIKRAGHVVKERFIDARVQETSCNSTEIDASSFPDTFNFKDPNKIYQTKASVEKIAPAPSVRTLQSLERREGSHEDETSPKSTPTCNQKLGLDSNDMSPVEVSDVSKKNKASFPYGKSSAEIDVLPFPDTFNCKDVNKIYQRTAPVEKIAPAPSIKTFPSLERTEDSHEDETSLKSTHTCSQRLRMDSLMSDSTHCTFNSNEHSLTCLKTVYEPAVVTSDGHQNMSFEEIGPGEGQFEGLHQMQFANHLKDVNDCEYGICTELDCLYMKELSLSYPDLTTETSECYSNSFECSDGCNFLLVSTSIISDTSNGSVYESVPDTSNNSDDESIHVKFLQNGTLNHIHDITLDSDDQENSNSKDVEENCGTIENTNPDVKQEISKETSSDPSSDIQIDNSEHIFPLISNIEIICLIFYYMYIFMRLVEGYYVLGEPIEHSSLNENSTTDFIIQTLIRAENNLDILVYYMLQIMKRLQMSKVYNSNEDENLIIPCRNQSEFSVTEIKVDSLKEISSKVDNFDTFRDPRGMLNIAVKDGKCSEKQQSDDLSETLALCCLFQYCIMVLLIELHKDKLGEGIDKEEENFSIIDEHKLTDSQEDVIIGSTLRTVKHGSSTENHMKSQKVMLPDTDKIRNDSFKVHSEHKKNSFESNNSTSSWNKRVKDKRRKRKRKCKRFKKNTCTLKPESQSINHSNHVNNINSKCSKEDRPNQKENSFAKDFCHKCHHYKVNANVCCSECRCELNSIKYQCQVRSREDSGIASCLSSLRSSILLEFDQLQPFHSTKQNSKTRNRSLRKFLKLGLLGQDLRRITKEVNSRALANIERDGVVLPWLQSYFDSLRNGITPSLQEQMVYEWLRLLSFSSYTGGGSPVHLARSGFYLHHGNETHCYSCDASYSTWSYTDNVDEIHRRISPNCPFINGGLASSGNISIDSKRQDNQSSLSAQNSGRQENLSSQSTQSQARSQLPHHGRDTTNQPAPEGLYSFRPNMGSFQGGIPSATASATNISPAFSFYPSSTVNSPPGLSFSQLPSASSRPTGRVYSLAEVTNQLGALTLQQQTSSIQQPTEEPQSRNPFIVPTQLLQTPVHIRGGAQLTVSDHQTPKGRQQNNAGNQPVLTGVADFARCFCCGGGLRNWEADDDPMVEHARWYPLCEYIIKLKGSQFVQAVLRRHREQMSQRQGSSQNTFATPDPLTMSVTASLLEMGFTLERAREAILTVRRLKRRSEVTAEEVTAWMLDDATAPRSQPEPPPAVASSTSDQVRRHQEPEKASAASTTVSSSGSSETTSQAQGSPSAASTAVSSSGSSETTSQAQGSPSAASTTVSSSGSPKTASQAHGSLSGSTGSLSEIQGATGSSVIPKMSQRQGSSQNTFATPDPMTTSVAASLLEMGFTQERAREAILTVRRLKRRSEVTLEEVTAWMLDDETAPRTQPGLSPAEMKCLEEENEMLKQEKMCKICMDQNKSVTFLPCGHHICCEDCAKSMRKCPICRKRIEHRVRTYVS